MTRLRRNLLCAIAAVASTALPLRGQVRDADRDGLPDPLEQALLQRFLPTFVISAGECDEKPAAFVPGRRDPRVASRDGTIYGHVIRHPQPLEGAAEIEVQYFHLWGRDCGRSGHALDAEHVSALLTAPSPDAPADAWQAEYWYAGAHEGTICDASSGATARALRATAAGPYVYISRGKHASYLNRGQCKWGCGGDTCALGSPLPRGPVVNIGERDAPLNGADWVNSSRWALAAKLSSDFDPGRRADMDRAGAQRIAVLQLGLRAFQSPILGGDTGLDALEAAGEAISVSSAAAGDAATTALDATGQAVGLALRKTGTGIARFLRLKR